MNSSLKRMWQKFFLLLRMAMISPHWSNISLMISSVAFSGKPPTNTVLQPGGRSRVDGGGRSEGCHIMFSSILSHAYIYYDIISFHYIFVVFEEESLNDHLYRRLWPLYLSHSTDSRTQCDLTRVLREQSAALAVNDLLDDWHVRGYGRGRDQADARHHGVNGRDESQTSVKPLDTHRVCRT